MQLQAKKISITIKKDDRVIIEDFSYVLRANDKTVIIGEEGNGKSTILKLLYSESLIKDYASFSGEIVRDGKFGYLPQFLSKEDSEKSVVEFLEDTDYYSNYNYVNDLNLDYDLIISDRLLSTLSGGEKIKIQLLKLLCEYPDALFLDEPSNDLDIDTLSFLESFIINSSIPIIFISHDEQLIEHSANTIIHVEQLIRKTKSKITISRLCYKEYLDSRNLSFLHQTQIAKKERSEHKKKRERLLQLFEKARNNGGWRNSDGTPSSDGHAKRSMQAIKAKEKRMERESEEFTEIPDREDEIITRFDSTISIPKQKIILDYTIDSLSVDDKILAHNIKLKVVGNQHICIIGSNGIGKSTLLKEIWKLLAKRTDIKVGYMPQNYEDVLDFSQTPTEFLESQYDKEEQTRARMFLGNMKFTADEMLHKISELSGGQKAKLIFLNMVLKKCDVLILDEPTRNFSPLSSPVVCKALMNFGGTIISISHDRRYLNDVADIVYVLSPTGLTLL